VSQTKPIDLDYYYYYYGFYISVDKTPATGSEHVSDTVVTSGE